jgi:predicted nucleotidyltransferase
MKACELIQQVFEQRSLKLNKIVLFGSSARGNETAESDVDFIIVSESFRNRALMERADMMSGLNRMLVKTLDRPVDTLYYSDEEWEEGYSLTINAAKEEGEVVYG